MSKKNNSIIEYLEYIRNTAFCSNTICKLQNFHNGHFCGYKMGILTEILTPEEIKGLNDWLLWLDPDYPDNSGFSKSAYAAFADYIKFLENKYSNK